jgi:hypothetical protein
VDAWTFIWLMLILKIPVVALLLLVRWAIRQEPEESSAQEDGGLPYRPTGPRHPRHPHHPHPRLPRLPRRGAHRGVPEPLAPMRVRTSFARAGTRQR